jgi:hypothetical protein
MGTNIQMPPIPTANKKKTIGCPLNFKRLSQDWGQTNFSENLRASLFNDQTDPSFWTVPSMISTFLLFLQRIGYSIVLKVLYRVPDTMPRHNIKSLFLLEFFSMIRLKTNKQTIEIKHNICTKLPNN